MTCAARPSLLRSGKQQQLSQTHIRKKCVFIRFPLWAGGLALSLRAPDDLAAAYIESFTQVINNEGRAGMGDPNALILGSCCYLFYALSRPGLEMRA
jgi:hypothetical protein